MSNFVCSNCGTPYIDCGDAGYKTPKEIELEKKLDIAVKALKEINSKYRFTVAQDVVYKSLKEIKEVNDEEV